MKKLLLPLYFWYLRTVNKIQWIKYLKNSPVINLVVGASETSFPGWFSSEIYTLDLTKEDDFKKYFTKKKINKVLAEHVLEHLTTEDLEKMLSNFNKYCADNINIRIAVPDGFSADLDYINKVKPGGYGAGSHDHKHLFDYKSLSGLFAKYGFEATPVEYWDEKREFHTTYKNDENGYVSRCFINDDRNRGGKIGFTSLIIDFRKKK